jgi:hypothetical protein
MFSLIIDYWIDSGIYNAFIMIIINLIIDKSRLCYKITIKYWQNVLILSYTRIKPRSRPPQKKIRIFYAPRFFRGQNRKKSVQITQANAVFDCCSLKFYLTNWLTLPPQRWNFKTHALRHLPSWKTQDEIILKWRVWCQLVWLWIGTRGRLLWVTIKCREFIY